MTYWSCNCGAKGVESTFGRATLFAKGHKRKKGGPACRTIRVYERKTQKTTPAKPRAR